jgi:hypothetical protein
VSTPKPQSRLADSPVGRAAILFFFSIIGVEGALAIATFDVSLGMTHRVDVPFTWMFHDFIFVFSTPMLTFLLPIGAAAFLLRYLRGGGLSFESGRLKFHRVPIKLTNSFLAPRDIAYFLRLMIVLMVFWAGISNIKPLIALYNPRVHDPQLLKLDMMLCGGVDIYKWMAQFRQPWVMKVMDEGYQSLFQLFLISLVVLYVQRHRFALKQFVLAVILCTIVANMIHFLYPTRGDAFIRIHIYDDLPYEKLFSRMVQIFLNRQFHNVMENPQTFEASMFVGIAAMPSLHCAQAGLFLYFAWKYHRWLLWLYVPAITVLTISTLYFGWHYISDCVVGYLMTAASIPVSRWLIQGADHLKQRALRAET